MKTRTAVLAGLLAALTLTLGCRSTSGDAAHESDTARAARFLTGVFSSGEQARTNANYFEVRLVVHPIWRERADGPWLYVEQAMATALDRPYRQRVYHLVADTASVVSEVYELPDPAAAVGCFKDDAPLAALTPGDLVRRQGCEIVLVPVGADEFQGSTIGASCPSTLNGASHATSQVVLRENVLESWDRGFDAAGQQVWGARDGAYVFVREAGDR
jgi:hypothetical protein